MIDITTKIAEGLEQLLSAEDICKRLSISRSTFDRWVRNHPQSLDTLKSKIPPRPNIMDEIRRRKEEEEEGKISFPPPDIRIGKSPRWTMTTFKKWIEKNLNQIP